MIAIGDELLIGQVTDTNSGMVARAVEPLGWSLGETRVVHDDAGAIRGAVTDMLERYCIVLVTGGLGPTKDDITKSVLAEMFGGRLVESAEVLENVRRIFRRRGLDMNRLTATQALVPDCCTVLENEVGTAPLMVFRQGEKMLVSMPGVPFEAEHAMTAKVLPMLRERFAGRGATVRETLVVAGITESDMAEALESVEEALPHELHLAYLPQQGYIRLRVDGHAENAAAAEEVRVKVAMAVEDIRAVLGSKVIAVGDKSVEQVVMERLQARGMTMGAAESCTGGNIAHVMTMMPGVSGVFAGSVTSYSNAVKTGVLGVRPETLERFGAVSEPTAEEMADGARRILGVDIAVATSGIAGPGGGSEEKPVGTVCMAVSTAGATESRTYHLPGDRARVINRATTEALKFLLEYL